MNAPTVVICVDGLDPEYLEACRTPVLRALAAKGFLHTVRSMMPSVTNVNNVSMVTGAYPEAHGICSNYWLPTGSSEGTYMESGEYILQETFFQRAQAQGKTSVLVTSKDKLRTLLGDGASFTVSSERPPDWVVEGVGPPPEIYSLEVNGWAVKAAAYVMSAHPADLVYISTTDYAMHTYPPEHPRSQEHVSILDNAIGELLEAHPDITLLLTADHGMSRKTRMLDLEGVLGARGIQATAVPIIKDRYVVHHSNLGGSIYLYLRPQDQDEALKILKETPGVDGALGREEAAARFRLNALRIGDILVNGEKDVVFSDPAEVEIPPQLRSHGSTHETQVPLLGYNGDFAGFAFDENRDIGRYIFERVLG